MAERTHSLADGQLAAASATVLGGSAVPQAGYVSGVFSNTSDSEVTVRLFFSRAGGTARQLPPAVLQADETLAVSNLPMQPDDTLTGYASIASAVDYLIFTGHAGRFGQDVLDASGTPKGVSVLRKILMGVEFLADGSLVDPG